MISVNISEMIWKYIDHRTMGKEFLFRERTRIDNMAYEKFIDENGRKWSLIHSITVAYPERTKPYSVSLAEKAKVAIKLTVCLQSN